MDPLDSPDTLSYRFLIIRDGDKTMNFSETIDTTLNKASAFDLYRLRAAIDRVLGQPGWMDVVRSRLRIGQTIEYFDPQANRPHSGQVLDLRRKQAVVLDLATQKRWNWRSWTPNVSPMRPSEMAKTGDKYSWSFGLRFRRGAFGWRSDRAITRIR